MLMDLKYSNDPDLSDLIKKYRQHRNVERLKNDTRRFIIDRTKGDFDSTPSDSKDGGDDDEDDDSNKVNTSSYDEDEQSEISSDIDDALASFPGAVKYLVQKGRID